MNWWQMETKEAARRLETDEKQGLTSQMAAERLAPRLGMTVADMTEEE